MLQTYTFIDGSSIAVDIAYLELVVVTQNLLGAYLFGTDKQGNTYTWYTTGETYKNDVLIS